MLWDQRGNLVELPVTGEIQKMWGTGPGPPGYAGNVRMDHFGRYLSTCDVLGNDTRSLNDSFHFVDDTGTGKTFHGVGDIIWQEHFKRILVVAWSRQ